MTQFEMGLLMGQIDDKYIQEAAHTYGSAQRNIRGTGRSAAPSNKSFKKTIRIALVAAVIAAALMTVAYAANLFGLRDLLILGSSHKAEVLNGELSVDQTYLSLAGITGFPEYKASEEWINWRAQYEAAQPEGWINNDWTPSNSELLESVKFYPCYNDEMLQKLLEVSKKFNLKLHTLSSTSISMEDFYAKAGTEAFVQGANQPAGGYIYEDGSFRLDGSSEHCEDGMYTLLRNMTGTLPPMESSVWNQANYTESIYRTALGAEVVIARNAELSIAYIFYQQNNAFVQLSARVSDETAAKALADTFDFTSACTGEPRVLEMVNAAPNAAEVDGAVTLEGFAASPEYKGLREFVDYIHLNGFGNYDGLFPVPEEYKWGYPTDFEEKTAEICEAYSLTAHTAMREIYDYSDACQAAGVGDFVINPNNPYGGFNAMKLYEDGSFDMNHGFFYYIRKGALCTSSQYVASWLDLPSYETSWQYETASGAVVCCATGAGQASMVLYETPLAWVAVLGSDYNMPAYALEAIADCYDFTKLP